MYLEQEFGDLVTHVGEPQECCHATPAAQSLPRKAVEDPKNIRAFILHQPLNLVARLGQGESSDVLRVLLRPCAADMVRRE